LYLSRVNALNDETLNAVDPEAMIAERGRGVRHIAVEQDLH